MDTARNQQRHLMPIQDIGISLKIGAREETLGMSRQQFQSGGPPRVTRPHRSSGKEAILCLDSVLEDTI